MGKERGLFTALTHSSAPATLVAWESGGFPLETMGGQDRCSPAGAGTRRRLPSAGQGLFGSAHAGRRASWAGLGHPGMERRGSAQEISHLRRLHSPPGCFQGCREAGMTLNCWICSPGLWQHLSPCCALPRDYSWKGLIERTRGKSQQDEGEGWRMWKRETKIHYLC